MIQNSLPLTPRNATDKASMTSLTDLSGKKILCKTFRSGDGMPAHHNPTDVFVLVIDGALDITLLDDTRQFVAGDWVVFPARQTHALRCIDDAKVLIIK